MYCNSKIKWVAVIVIAFIAIILGGISCVRLEQKEQKTDAYHRMNLYAAEGNDHALRQMLAQKLVDVNHIEKGKPGLLENAVRGGHLSTVELLLDAGVKPEIKGVYSIPIAMAIERADVPMVKVLLAHGAHPKNCYIVKADDTQNKELIKILLAAGAEPHTFIFQAADNGNTTLLRLSLEALTDGISQDKDAKTARCIELSLARAKEKGHTDLVRILSEYQRQMSLQD